MQTSKCIKTRRSRREYTDKKVSEETVTELIDCARHASYGGPPVKEGQPWEFVVVRDDSLKNKLALDYEDRQFVTEAPIVIAVCIDKKKDPDYKAWESAGAAAAQNILLAAHDMGLGTCWVSTFQNHSGHKEDRQKLIEVLNLPDNIYLVALITLGYSDPQEEMPEKRLRSVKKIKQKDNF